MTARGDGRRPVQSERPEILTIGTRETPSSLDPGTRKSRECWQFAGLTICDLPHYGLGFNTVSFTLFPASVAAPCTLLFTRFFSAFVSLAARFDVLLMLRATLLRPPG